VHEQQPERGDEPGTADRHGGTVAVQNELAQVVEPDRASHACPTRFLPLRDQA
jgi:hypothetical protein